MPAPLREALTGSVLPFTQDPKASQHKGCLSGCQPRFLSQEAGTAELVTLSVPESIGLVGVGVGIASYSTFKGMWGGRGLRVIWR